MRFTAAVGPNAVRVLLANIPAGERISWQLARDPRMVTAETAPAGRAWAAPGLL